MSLQHYHEKPPLETPRHDAQTVRQILALAGNLQTRHRATMTDEDVVELGLDVGLEVGFVRQALAQREAQAKVRATAKAAKKQRVQGWFASVWRRRAEILAAVYILVVPVVCIYRFEDDVLAVLLLVLCPGLLGVGAGLHKEKEAISLLVGGLFTLSSFIAAFGIVMHWHTTLSCDSFLFFLFTSPIVGAISGGMGGILGQRIRNGK